MNEHALDAMIYAWRVMKEKEESSMEGIYVGKVKRSVINKDDVNLLFIDHQQDIHHLGEVIDYEDTAYCLVPANDIIINNDELLKLRDEVKRLTEACNGWEAECNDEECNAGVVIVDNGKANELESQVVQMEDANQKLHKRISAADERIEDLESQIVKIADANKVVVQRLDAANKEIETLDKKLCRYQHDNDFKAESVIAAKDRGDHWKRNYEELTEYWDNTYKDIVAAGKKVGVKIDLKGRKPDGNVGNIDITNEKALELAYKLNNTRQTHDAKWSAMTEALKDKGVEVIYMGEQDGKPIIDIKVPGLDDDKKWVNTFAKDCADFRADKFRLERERDELKEQCDILRKDGVLKGQQYLKLKEDLNDLKKEYGRVLGEFGLCRKQAECYHKKLEELKSRTLDNVEILLSCGDIVWTYCDGFVHVSSGIDGIISADQITTGTVPKCSSCAYYMHNPSRYAHDWCYMPVPKEGGAGYIRKLNKEEVEGPACVDFKARKE